MGNNGMSFGSLSTRDDHEGLSTKFKVIIPGMQELVFRSCDGMEMETAVISYPEGGRSGAPRTARGAQHVSRISFSQGASSKGSGGRSIFDWYLDVADPNKALEKKTLSIVVTNEDGHDLAEWRILNAWPCRWVAPVMNMENNQLTVEYISFAHEGIERKK